MTQMLNEILNQCPLPNALEAMGERWSFMIMRGAINGLKHFEEFQSNLGIARNILANRLSRLVEKGILSREPMSCDRRKIEYRMTEKGMDLLPMMVALRQWGEKWECCVEGGPALHDKRDGLPIQKMKIFAHDGRELTADDLIWALPERQLASEDAPGEMAA
ncbi:MAG: helix-turn-helix domain-containing protein [Sphingobium sp.]|uniref:winged helix-turn-helix transcriptional regulator n=1 Tax=Sphingobium sp. TaxID=1912891 RepID=UPI0029BC4127|nr:helix-turn-helix domain-containing protein [Sphingobium sp.]MDX3909143.1 helix-turn-helix domain-containing protein [Sphingobium sp.]